MTTKKVELIERKFEVIDVGHDGQRIRKPGDGKGPVILKLGKSVKCPSWLKELKPETAAQKKKREAAEAKAKKAADDAAKQQQDDVENASFMGDGEKAGDGNVETLS